MASRPETTDLLMQLLNSRPEPFLAFDAAGNTIFRNQAAELWLNGAVPPFSLTRAVRGRRAGRIALPHGMVADLSPSPEGHWTALVLPCEATPERLALPVEDAADAIFVIDWEGRHIEVNPAASLLLGYTRDELLAMSIADLLDEHEYGRLDRLHHTLGTGATEVVDSELRANNGEWIPVELNIRRLPGFIWQVVIRDLRGRRAAEDLLRAAEERQRLAAEAGNVGLWDWDIDRDHVVWSDRLYQIYGLEPGEFDVTISAVQTMLHPDDTPGLRQALEDSFARNSAYQAEFRIIRPKSGEVRWLSTSARLIRDADGRPRRLLGATIDVTDRKDLERALAEQAERLQSTLASITDAFMVVSAERKVTFANAAALELLGCASTEALGPAANAILLEAIASGSPRNFEVMDSEGDRWFDVRVYPQPHDRGASLYFRDVTDRRKTGETLREVHEQLQALVRFSPLPIVTLDREGCITLWNPAAERLFGWTQEEVLGRALPFIPEEKREEHRRMRKRDLAGDSLTGVEVERVRKDGTRIHISVSTAALRNASGEVSGIMSLYQDITERRLNQERLATLNQDLERRVRDFETLLEVTPIGIVVAHGADCQEVRANRAFSEKAGIPGQENASWVNRDPEAIPYHMEIQGQIIAREDLPMRRAIRENRDVEYELDLVRHADGRRFSLYVYSSPIRDDAGVPRGAVAAFVDLTERKLIEAALLEVNGELRRANADLEQFAYAAAHDLQEPLRNITLYSQLLLRRFGAALPDEGHRFLRVLADGALRMEELVRDLLAYTTALGRCSDGDEARCAMNVAVERARDNLSAGISETGAQVEVETPLPTVGLPEAHAIQLLQNLIGNSLKYRMPGRAPVVRVRAEPDTDGFWRICVADNGIGIPPAYAQQIFGVFRRLHGHEIPGTGIGLAICKRLVEHYGGQIWVESEGDGQGSAFWITLPAPRGPGPSRLSVTDP